ncbi:glycosyltransferase [Candidatus Allofournierella merdipullorum]|uniref:glycosyltransferase n=1 Tax=Candidatus Allofournierella merdipullorum TaxID=2838595 RepID=UPI002A8B11E0|nr:glycosyltransferase [Candidatus Fournierella merdipullorum]
MKKLLYLALWNVVGEIQACGVSQKVFTQARAFVKLGYQTDVVMRSGNTFLLYHFPSEENEQWEMQVSKMWPQRKFFYKDVEEKLDLSSYDAFYIRYQLCDYYFWKLLRTIKRTKKNAAKVVSEIPTFPYADECKGSRKKEVLYLQDQLFAPRLKRCIDRFVIYGDQQQIYGIPTICTQNGVDVDAYPVRCGVTPEPGVIRLVGIASATAAHGYDRLLRGIAEYKNAYPDGCKFKVCIIGDGAKLAAYKELVREEDLEKEVFFAGRQPKSKLYEFLQNSDIGINALGDYRIGLNTTSSLKSREYLAYGLPFISASNVSGVAPDFPWILKVPNEDGALDMNEVVAFHSKICRAGADHVAAELHQHAKENVDIVRVLKCVVDFLDS